METLDYDHRVFTEGSGFDREADKNLAVRFFTHPIRNDEKTASEGRPIFDDQDMVEIRVRGDRNNIIIRPVRPEDTMRFRDAWKAFEQREDIKESGTPLKEWPIMAASTVEELRYMGFFTVEQVANASDSVCSKFAGLQNFKQKAKLYIEQTKDANAVISKLAKENDDTKSQLEMAQRQIAELGRKLEELTAKK